MRNPIVGVDPKNRPLRPPGPSSMRPPIDASLLVLQFYPNENSARFLLKCLPRTSATGPLGYATSPSHLHHRSSTTVS